jgi:Lrp/AsnC family transcriptional regulator for asnA, asnC and gidA
MPPIERIDEIDAKILKDLLIEGRKEFTKIAKEIKVSKDVIWQHYNNMMKKKIIVGATIQLDYTVLGYDISANFIVDTPTNQQQQVMKDLRKIGGIYDAYRWGSPSRIWAVTGLMKTDQIELVKQKIKKVLYHKTGDAAQPIMHAYNVKIVLLLFYQAIYEFCSAENIVNKNVIEEFYVGAPFL